MSSVAKLKKEAADLEAKKQFDKAVKVYAKLFAEFEKHLAEVSPWIWLYTSYSYTAQQKNIAGFVPTPTGTLFSLSKVTIQQ